MRRLGAAVLVALACLVVMGSQAGRGQEPATKGARPNAPAAIAVASPLGFTPAARVAHLRAEAKALAVPTPEKARSWLRTLTAEPHPAGSPADYKTALFVRDQLREWGWKADIAEYEVLLNVPRSSPESPYLRLVQPTERTLSLVEAPHAADKDSANSAAFPAFHGYGVSGDARGQVVYANLGQPDDFATLERLGIDVKDKIVLVRYGAIFRGLKVRNAQKRGARGVLIYSDPADDGFAKGDTYPTGPFRPPSALQRGSVQFLSLGPGDPTTPTGPSTKGAQRLPWDPRNGFTLSPQPIRREVSFLDADKSLKTRVETSPSVEEWEKATDLKREDYFATIPSLPISHEAARPILEALGGPNVPEGWQGGLPLAYHIGPGPAEVAFGIEMDYQLRPIWNVIATIKGTVEPDRWVMVGNHRDAWVYGAVDPSSGTAATLEACRALGAAVKEGWQPRRTLVYASWDAEEYGLVGSTEWADEHAKELDAKAALMLNVDSAVAGQELDLDGVPSLRDYVLDACSAVTDARTGKTLRDLWVEKKRAAWAASAPLDYHDPLWNGAPNADDPTRPPGTTAALLVAKPATAFSPRMNPLGSGSDYTAFLDHLGIPAIDVGFAGRYGVYHSIFDNLFWMEKFCDPEFLTHATAARLYTALAMRGAGADILPFTFVPYGEALRDHLDDLRRIVARRERAAGGATQPLGFEGLPALIAAVKRFQATAADTDQLTTELAARDDLAAERVSRVNDALQRVERAWLHPEGLPGRPWFKHAVYAPGLTTGYASWPLPGVRQAVLENDRELLAAQVPSLVTRIDAATEALRAVAASARAALGPANRAAAAPAPPASPEAARSKSERD